MASTIKLLFGLVFLALVYFGSVYGADCYTDLKPDQVTISQYYQVRDLFCGADSSSNGKTYQFGFDGNRRKSITVTFSGNAKAKYCQTALSNIIGQCLNESCGRNACPKSGGKYDISYQGEEAHFTIRGTVA